MGYPAFRTFFQLISCPAEDTVDSVEIFSLARKYGIGCYIFKQSMEIYVLN
jgi:hypothetical protein